VVICHVRRGADGHRHKRRGRGDSEDVVLSERADAVRAEFFVEIDLEWRVGKWKCERFVKGVVVQT
jgi:hypothetical protein